MRQRIWGVFALINQLAHLTRISALDFVMQEIYGGDGDYYVLAGAFNLDQLYYVLASSVYLAFTSDSSDTNKGFKATYLKGNVIPCQKVHKFYYGKGQLL